MDPSSKEEAAVERHSMSLRHVVLDFTSKRDAPENKPPGHYQARYRDKMRQDPAKWQQYKAKQKVHQKNYVENLSEDKRLIQKEKTNQRQRERRQEQKAAKQEKSTPVEAEKPKTRKVVQESRLYWREQKRKQRAAMTPEQRAAKNQRERERRLEKKLATASTILSTPIATSIDTPQPSEAVTISSTATTTSIDTPQPSEAVTISSIPTTSSIDTPQPSEAITISSIPTTSSIDTPQPSEAITISSIPTTSSIDTPQPYEAITISSIPTTSSIDTPQPSLLHLSPSATANPPSACTPLSPIFESPSPTKFAKYNSLYRVKKSMPQSKKSKLYVLEKLIKNCSPSSKDKILKALSSPDPQPLPQEKTRKVKDSVVKQKIIDYFYTRALDLPDKRLFSKRLKVQRKVLNMPISSLYKDFLSENPNMSVSKRLFFKCRPRDVMTMKSMRLMQCLCEQCENMRLLLKCLCTVGFSCSSVSDSVSVTLCPYDGNWAALDCVQQSCSKCSTNALKVKLRTECDLTASVTYKYWDQVADEKCKGKKTKLVNVDSSVVELIDKFCALMHDYSLHSYLDKWQRHQFISVKKSLSADCGLIVLDFAENYTCHYQNQAQSAYYALDQVTLHPVVLYKLCPTCNEKQMTSYRIYISDDLKHDANFVNYVINDTIRSNDVSGLNRFIIFSDNCCSQYKSRLSVYHFGKLAQDFNLERCYFGERHGKSECDSSGGVVKSFLTQSVASGRAILTNANDIVDFLNGNFQLTNENCIHSSRYFYLVKCKSIDRSVTTQDVKPIVGIKKLHSFKVSEGILFTRELSCFCNGCSGVPPNKCVNNVPRFKKGKKVNFVKTGKKANSRTGGKGRVQCNEEFCDDGEGVVENTCADADNVPGDNDVDNVCGIDADTDNVPGVNDVDNVCGIDADDVPGDNDVDNVCGIDADDVPGDNVCGIDADDVPGDNDVDNVSGIDADDVSGDNVCGIDADDVSGDNVCGIDADDVSGDDADKTCGDGVANVSSDGGVENVCSDDVGLSTGSTSFDKCIFKETRRNLFHTVIKDEKHLYRSLYHELVACTSFEEMTFICNATVLKPITVSQKVVKVNLDFDALTLVPPNSPVGYLPNVTIEDGNCVPRSLSTLLYGTEIHHLEIRVRIIHELVTNKTLYLNKKFLAEGSNLDPNTVISKIVSVSDSLRGINLSDSETIFKTEVFETRLAGKFLGPWHLHAAAQMLRCGIVSLYPCLGPVQNRDIFARVFLPTDIEYESHLTVLWTSRRKDMKKEHWVANHVVPMVKMHH